MTFDWWLTYLVTTFILSLSPGSGAINTMSTTISHGKRGVVASIAGLQLGLALHIVLVGIGLAALFPQFVLPHQPQAAQYLILGATTLIVDIIVMIGYAALATRIAGWIKAPHQMKLLNRIFGGLFMLIGALLATAKKV